MKILYSCLSKSWGGMEMFTITAAKQLLKRNISVELICSAESRIHIEANNSGLILYPLKASGYFNLLSTIKTALLIKKRKYDVIHTQASKDLWLIVPALKIISSKIPLILTKQVGSFVIKKDFLHKWIYNRVTYAIAISRIIKKNLLDTCPLNEERILLLPNGIDTKRFSPEAADRKKIRNEFQIKDNELLIGMLARFSPGKGHEDFLLASKLLNQKFNNLRFIIVGEASRGEDDYAERIKRLAADYKLKNIIFSGYRSDTPDVLAAMDIFVFPSHSEAFGIALVEAMAMAKPSVCSNADGVLDIAVDGETSLLFENRNGEDLFKKIEMLILSPEKMIEFGKAARKRAMEKFNLEVLTDKVSEIYKSTFK